ncbi:MAG TPA: hypothetical protein VFP50_20265 [Anaeromyxobacteraceae bacterium]|nr:hypothetical protein [Anaeromyxobacteraceae bacterium]
MTMRLRDRLLTILGDIKVFRFPLFVIYDPGSYLVRGGDMRELIELVRPGDVLVRGYTMYLDGKLIPGYFSHAGLYVGPVTEADRALAPERHRGRVAPGAQLVIHAVAEGVGMVDVLDFARCDRLLVLRFPEVIRARPGAAPDPDAPLDDEERVLRDRLLAGGEVRFAEAWPAVRRAAFAQLGRGYDFDFDFTDVKRLSCTELVHRAVRCLAPFHGVQPERHRVLFLSGTGITPDAWVASPLELAWRSRSTQARRVDALRARAPAPAA